MEIDLYGLNYDERESLYKELEIRYLDYDWIEHFSYKKKYNKWNFELIGHKND